MAARAASMLAAAALVVAAILATTSGCMQTLIGMSPCLNYITGNETTPSKSCCSQLANVVSSKPECLCVALGLGNANKTRALGLPDDCGILLSITNNCASAPTTAGQTPTSSGAGRIMAGTHSEKINLPNGLCVHESHNNCSKHGYCFCCLANSICYDNMDECKSDCKN